MNILVETRIQEESNGEDGVAKGDFPRELWRFEEEFLEEGDEKKPGIALLSY